MSDKELPIGTKIKFIRTIQDGPDDYGPGNHYATKGDNGVVTVHGCHEGHCVKWEHWPFPFGAILDIDFEVVETDQLNIH